MKLNTRYSHSFVRQRSRLYHHLTCSVGKDRIHEGNAASERDADSVQKGYGDFKQSSVCRRKGSVLPCWKTSEDFGTSGLGGNESRFEWQLPACLV